MLEIKNLYKTFGTHEVLKGIDLKVEKGQVVAVLGSSGSGKTTMLRCLSFLEHAEKGEIHFDEFHHTFGTVTMRQIHEMRMQMGFVFQGFHLFANKTAFENVCSGLTIARRLPKEKAGEIAREMLRKVGMEDRADYYPAQLSGGQQQRVAIARAIATNPRIVLFDEPTSALDPELTGEVLDVMKELASEGMTMIVVTHEMEFARDVANQVVFMDQGTVVETGEAKEFFSCPKQERTLQFLRRTLKDYNYYI